MRDLEQAVKKLEMAANHIEQAVLLLGGPVTRDDWAMRAYQYAIEDLAERFRAQANAN